MYDKGNIQLDRWLNQFLLFVDAVTSIALSQFGAEVVTPSINDVALKLKLNV